MNKFLEKHLLLSNKNNILDIRFGKKNSDNIFNGNINKNTIKNIIDSLKSDKNYKIRVISYTIETYIKNNEYFTLNRNEINYEIYNLKDYCLTDEFLLKNIEIVRDEFIIPTYNTYHNIEESEILDIKINNQLIVRVKELKGKCSLSIIINKPIELSFLTQILDIIRQ